MTDIKFHISSSPHFSLGNSTQKIMACVLVALLPEVVAGTVFFGFRALAVVLFSVLGCVFFEALFQKITGQKIVVANLSAAVSGVMLALVLPSTVPLWMVFIGDFVAMVIAKGLFGGIGSNVFNPALTGRAFLFISFPAAIGATWFDPNMSHAEKWDGITSATVLSQIKAGTLEHFDFLQFFIGNRAGCIGETSILLILISFVFLLVAKIIDWRAPVAMVGTVVVCTFVAGLSAGISSAVYDVGITLLTGGLIFGATFMVTDYATAPVTKPGRLIFGAGAGLITFLVRKFGGYPEGVMFSILIMNAVVPFLNNVTGRMYGYGKRGHRRLETAKINMEFDLNSAKERKIADSADSTASADSVATTDGGKND